MSDREWHFYLDDMIQFAVVFWLIVMVWIRQHGRICTAYLFGRLN